MPEHFPVEIEVKGSAYATVSMPPYYGYYNPQTVKADASLVDFFRVTSLSRTTPGTVIYNIPNGVLGTAYSATGSLFWGNGYETTIELAINASTMSSAMTSGPLCYSKSETSTILTIKKIGNQVM